MIKLDYIERQLKELQNLAKPLGYEVTLVVSYDYCMWLFHIFDENGKFQIETGYRGAINFLAGRQVQKFCKAS